MESEGDTHTHLNMKDICRTGRTYVGHVEQEDRKDMKEDDRRGDHHIVEFSAGIKRERKIRLIGFNRMSAS